MASKYSNVRTNGFASKKEARRYQELKLLEKGGVITNLSTQVVFPFRMNDVLICRYVADFTYFEDGAEVVEDTKGFRTPVYRLKANLMKAFYNITIKET